MIREVLEGRSDAGVLSSCQLEIAETAGLVTPGLLRVIEPKQNPALACQHSTELYPDQVFGALNFKRPDLVRSVTVALLGMEQPQTGKGASGRFLWQVPGKFDSVTNLYKTLEIGPWAYMKDWSPAGIVKRFWKYILTGFGFIGLLLLYELRLQHLVRKRTAELSQALEEKAAVVDRLRQMTSRVDVMQRHTLVSQLSSIIAHELKQPIASIINYCAIQRIEAEARGEEDSGPAQAAAAIDEEAKRMSEIVDRVRSYAKGKERPHQKCDLGSIVKSALVSFQNYQDYVANVRPEISGKCFVAGDSLELEILVLNLLKNAGRAVKKQKEGAVRVSLRKCGGQIELVVEDNGPELTDADMKRVLDRNDSTDSNGLGLGLSIVRAVVDAHSGSIHFERAVPHGLRAVVRFDEF